MPAILLVAIGGALGAVLRWGSVTAVQRWAGDVLPWGTLFVNVVGSFLLGCLLFGTARLDLSDGLRQLLVVGVLGAFTTFSALSWEVAVLLRDGAWLRAGTYMVLSLVLGVGALVAGGWASGVLFARS